MNESMGKQTLAYNDLKSPESGDKTTANEIVVRELSIVSSGKAVNCPTVVVVDKTGMSREFQLMQVSFQSLFLRSAKETLVTMFENT